MATRRPGLFSRWLSVATQLSLLVVVVAIASLAVTIVVALDRGSDLARGALDARLETIATTRGDEVARYLSGLGTRVSTLARSPGTASALEEFTSAHAALGGEPVPEELAEGLGDFYLDEIVPPLEDVRGNAVAVASLLPTTQAAERLQSTWVTAGDGRVDPAVVDDNRDGTDWTAVHVRVHPAYRRIADQGGFTDLYLVSAADDVVYSVAKRIDLGTSLDVGPHSGGVLATTVAEVAADPQPGRVVVGDLSRTAAFGDRPVGIVASPVFDGPTFVGVVAGQFDGTELTSIMTNDGDWSNLGDTGQAYLAAADATMRSDDRQFVADPDAFLAANLDGLTPEQVRSMAALGTTVALQPVDTELVTEASDGPAVGPAVSPSGTEVVAAWQPMPDARTGLDGLDWTVVAELSQEEVEAPIAAFTRELLIAAVLFILVVTFVGVAWANRLVAPLRVVARRLRAARGTAVPTSVGTTPGVMPARMPREFVALSTQIDDMLHQLDARGRDVEQRRGERIDLLRQFLPPTVIGRAEAGEQDILDRAEHASVVTVVLRGLGALVRGDSGDAVYDALDGFVDDLDAAARRLGLERFRLSGDTYQAVCGASRPVLDHAPRAVRFATDVFDLASDVQEALGQPVAVSIGVTAGPVTFGLTGGARLMFDCWGPTVDRSRRVARMTDAGRLVIDETVRRQLPDAVETAPMAPGTDPGDGDAATVGLSVVVRTPVAAGDGR